MQAPLPSVPTHLSDFASLVEQGQLLVSTQDADYKISYVSPALAALLGNTQDELVGRSYSELFRPADYASLREKLAGLHRAPVSIDNYMEVLGKDSKPRWLSIRFARIASNGSSGSFIAFYQDQRRLKQSQDILGALAFEPTVVTDERFFEGLVWNTAQALEIDYAFLTVSKAPFASVRMLAFWKGDHFAAPYEYNLDDTPCDRVIRHGETCFVPLNVQGAYPKDQDLVGLRAQSYLGVPIFDHAGIIRGHLALLDKRPLKMTSYIKSVTTIFARQLASILEKLS